MNDLFEHPELLTLEMKELFFEWEDRGIDGLDYLQLEKMLEEFELFGYTFDYGLDAEPYDLRPL